jgi:hypothetical protein
MKNGSLLGRMGIPRTIVGLLWLAACSPAAPPPAAGPDLASARAFVDSFLTALAQPTGPGDAARLDTVDFVWARSGALIGHDSLVSLLAAQRAAGTAIVLGTSDAHLTPLGADAVAWSGIVSGVVRDSAGGERPVRGALTLMLRRRDGGWAIAAGHESVRPYDDAHEASAAHPR